MHHRSLGSCTGINGWVNGIARRGRRRGALSLTRRSRSSIVEGAGHSCFGSSRCSTARGFLGPQYGRRRRSVTIAAAISVRIANPCRCGARERGANPPGPSGFTRLVGGGSVYCELVSNSGAWRKVSSRALRIPGLPLRASASSSASTQKSAPRVFESRRASTGRLTQSMTGNRRGCRSGHFR
jgi:hypothetical protein